MPEYSSISIWAVPEMNVTFFKPKKHLREARRGNWSNQEIADFYRAMDVLRQAGLDTPQIMASQMKAIHGLFS